MKHRSVTGNNHSQWHFNNILRYCWVFLMWIYLINTYNLAQKTWAPLFSNKQCWEHLSTANVIPINNKEVFLALEQRFATMLHNKNEQFFKYFWKALFLIYSWRYGCFYAHEPTVHMIQLCWMKANAR